MSWFNVWDGHKPEVKPEKPKWLALEPVDFPDPVPTPNAPLDMVVDFGTTATVVAVVTRPRDAEGGRAVGLRFLAGDTELSSDMAIDEHGRVAEIGKNSFNHLTKNPKSRFYSSLKRYLELESRGAAKRAFSEIVSGFLQLAIDREYKKLSNKAGHSSRIVISVPNSFNPKAVEDVRQGVIKAITALNAPEPGITAANIRVARESEAIAYLYHRGTMAIPAPVSGGNAGQLAPFLWQSVDSGMQSASLPPGSPERLVVLDVGGGTTDLSLVEVVEDDENPGRKDVRLRVILNAGVPLGGTDVDKLLLRAALDDVTPTLLEGIAAGVRNDVTRWLRAEKEKDAQIFFSDPPAGQADELSNRIFAEIIRRFDPNTVNSTLKIITGSADRATLFREEANLRLKMLTEISVAGLFNMIPKDERRGITKVLLTGRASQLQQIRDAVVDQAKKLGAEILTLAHPYHLKLAVAYGCGLIRYREFSGAKLPSGTMGRQLRLFGEDDRPSVEFNSDFPISGSEPTLWKVTYPSPIKQPVRYELNEYSISLPLIFFSVNSPEALGHLGCCRVAANWTANIQGFGHPTQTVMIARHPETELYYIADPSNRDWLVSKYAKLDLKAINLVTGLPLGFPHEDI